MNIQKLSYVFLLCFSVFTFTGCEDDENGGKPQTVGAYGSIPTEALNKMHWKWGIASRINDETTATFVCNRDSLGGGYVAAFSVDGFNSHTTLTFFVDDRFDVTTFLMGTSSEYNANTYIVQQKGGNIYLTGTANGNTKHRTYALRSPYGNSQTSSDPFSAVASSILSFSQNIDFLSENLKSYGRDFIGKVASGDYAGQPVYDGQALFPEYDAVCNLNHLETIRRLITGESAVYLDSSENLYGKGPDGKSYVTVYARINTPTETFNRNPEEGEYGATKALKLYCGLLIGQHNVLGRAMPFTTSRAKNSCLATSNPRLSNCPTLPPAFIMCAPISSQKMNFKHRRQAKLIHACYSMQKTQEHT